MNAGTNGLANHHYDQETDMSIIRSIMLAVPVVAIGAFAVPLSGHAQSANPTMNDPQGFPADCFDPSTGQLNVTEANKGHCVSSNQQDQNGGNAGDNTGTGINQNDSTGSVTPPASGSGSGNNTGSGSGSSGSGSGSGSGG